MAYRIGGPEIIQGRRCQSLPIMRTRGHLAAHDDHLPGREMHQTLGMGLIQRSGPVKSLLMAEARGEAGALPKLLEGVAV